MGTNLQERVAQQRLERVSTRERECKHKASWSNNRPNAINNKMGKRQSQRKSVQPQTFLSQENNIEKRPQQRRKHKPNTFSTKRTACRHSVQGTLESNPHLLSPAKDRMELKVQVAAQNWEHREQTNKSSRASRHTPPIPRHRLSESSPDLVERHSPKLDDDSLREEDSDTDLSESERLPVLPSVWVPPQLELRPEVMDVEGCTAQRHRVRGQSCDGFDFPDFLPPPFNSWNLRQLAFFHNMEGRGAPRPRPVGSLERYLERLLQLEWHQIQTVHKETGKSTVSDVTHGCHRSAAAAASRLSTPKCILQCQRAFPLTFLSTLVSHSALLSGCACILCRIRYSTCSTSCCRSSHIQAHQSRISPILERREPVSLPRRSYSESRVHSSQRRSDSQRYNSPVRANNHLRRMQASGNIRNPVQGTNIKPQFTAGVQGKVIDCRTVGVRKRSGSEQHRSGAERQQNGSERKRSGSECRRRGTERWRTAEFRDIKQHGINAILDNLPASKHSVDRTNRHKQVDFVT